MKRVARPEPKEAPSKDAPRKRGIPKSPLPSIDRPLSQNALLRINKAFSDPDAIDPVWGSGHDKYFRGFASHRENILAFCRVFLPTNGARYDFTRAKLKPDEYLDDRMNKFVADAVLAIPAFDEKTSEWLDVPVIVEHKSRLGGAEDVRCVVNAVLYSALETSSRAREVPREKLVQPRFLLAYAGGDPTQGALTWKKIVRPAPGAGSKEPFGIEFTCVNFAKLVEEGAITWEDGVDEPKARALSFALILGSALSGKLRERRKLIFAPFRAVKGKLNVQSLGFIRTSLIYAFNVSASRGEKFTLKDLDEALVAAFNKDNKNVKKEFTMGLIDEMIEKGKKAGIEIGEKRGEKRGEQRGEKRGEKRGKKTGIEIGEKRGIKKGSIRTLSNLVKKGLLTLTAAAEEANLSEAEFKRKAALLAS